MAVAGTFYKKAAKEADDEEAKQLFDFLAKEENIHYQFLEDQHSYLKDPKIYDPVMPTTGALEGVNALRELNYRVLFATSCPVEVAGRKFYWLKQYGFIKKERDYIEIRDKSLLKGDFMIDDNYDNCNTFSGYGYLMKAPWNIKYNWHYRANDWEDFIKIMAIRIEKEI